MFQALFTENFLLKVETNGQTGLPLSPCNLPFLFPQYQRDGVLASAGLDPSAGGNPRRSEADEGDEDDVVDDDEDEDDDRAARGARGRGRGRGRGTSSASPRGRGRGRGRGRAAANLSVSRTIPSDGEDDVRQEAIIRYFVGLWA